MAKNDQFLCRRTLVLIAIAFQYWLLPIYGSHGISKRATVAFVEAPINTTTTLTCHPRPLQPPYLISWRKENSVNAEFYIIVNSNNNNNPPHVATDYQGRVQLADYASLTIRRLQRRDSSLWECLTAPIRNGVAVSSQQVIISVQLQVDVPPTIAVDQAIIYSSLSTTVTLKCFIDGVPNPNIQWWKKNGQLPSGRYRINSGQMQVLDLLRQDYGIYTCSANNVLGTATGEILVMQPGNYTATQQQYTTIEGNSIIFNCDISVTNAVENIIWTFQQSLFDITTYNRFQKLANGSLMINGILRRDSGMFTCSIRLSDNFKSQFLPQTRAIVNVMFPPRIINTSPFVLASIGYSKILPCQIEANPNITSLRWSRNNIDTSTLSRYTILANGNLKIEAVQPQDADSFTCRVENAIGVATHTMQLNIVEPPQFLKVPPSTVQTDSGKRVILVCTVRSQTPVTIIWKKMGSGVISNSNATIVVDGILTIFAAQQRDSGTYTCFADNGAVSISTATQLKISSPPSPPTNVSILSASFTSATIAWSAGYYGGYPQIIQLWYKRVEWLQTSWLLIAQLDSTVNRYNYDQLTPSFRYQFRLRGENQLGVSAWSPLVWVRMQGYLNNTDEPNAPIGVHAVNGPNYIRVLWQPATSQPIALSHYAVQLRANQTLEWTTVNVTSHATERQIQVTNLIIDKVYTMRVIAYGQNTVPSQPSSITQILYIPTQDPPQPEESNNRDLVLALLISGLILMVLAIIFFIHREKLHKTVKRFKNNGFMSGNDSNSQRSNGGVIDIFHRQRSKVSSKGSNGLSFKNKGQKTSEEGPESSEANADIAVSDLEDLKLQTIPTIVIGTEVESNLTGMKKFMSVNDGSKSKRDRKSKGSGNSSDEKTYDSVDIRTTRVVVRAKSENKIMRPSSTATLDRSSKVMIVPTRYDSLNRVKNIQDKRFSTLPTSIDFIPYEHFVKSNAVKGEKDEKLSSRSSIKASEHEYQSLTRNPSLTAIPKYNSRSSLNSSQHYAKLEGTVAAAIDTTTRSSEVTHDSLSGSFYHTLPTGITVSPMINKMRRLSDDSSTISTSTNSASLPPPIVSSWRSQLRRDSSSSIASSAGNNDNGYHHYDTVANKPLKYVTKRRRINKTPPQSGHYEDLSRDEYGYYQLNTVLGKLDEDQIVTSHQDRSSGYYSRDHTANTSRNGTLERLQYQRAVDEYFSVIDDVSTTTSNNETAELDSVATKDTADSRSSVSYSPSIETTAESNHKSTTSLSSISSKPVTSLSASDDGIKKSKSVNSDQVIRLLNKDQSATSQYSNSDEGNSTLKKLSDHDKYTDTASQTGSNSMYSDSTLRLHQVDDETSVSDRSATLGRISQSKITRVPAQSAI